MLIQEYLKSIQAPKKLEMQATEGEIGLKLEKQPLILEPNKEIEESGLETHLKQIED